MKHLFLTITVMLAFAGNSLLCRAALAGQHIDPARFTWIRLGSGAVVLALIHLGISGQRRIGGNWLSALALFVYAAGFSFAYIHLSAGTGALLLFGMVQVTMIGWGLFRGEKLRMGQWFAFGMAFAGLIYLVLPGLEAPDMTSSMLMVAAGLGWGVYSLLGRGAGDPISKTAGNFIRACLFGLLLALWSSFQNAWDWQGVGLAVGSGAIASGLGYALWYRVLPSMRAATAATVQLSVPVIAASGGILLLEERLTNRLLLASLTILGGIAWFIQQRKT